jgi:hypothetical protein
MHHEFHDWSERERNVARIGEGNGTKDEFSDPRGAARELLYSRTRKELAMEAVVVGATLFGSFLGAFVIQKMALEGLFRMMTAGRRARH